MGTSVREKKKKESMVVRFIKFIYFKFTEDLDPDEAAGILTMTSALWLIGSWLLVAVPLWIFIGFVTCIYTWLFLISPIIIFDLVLIFRAAWIGITMGIGFTKGEFDEWERRRNKNDDKHD